MFSLYKYNKYSLLRMMKNNKVKRSTRIMFYKQHLIFIRVGYSNNYSFIFCFLPNFCIEINRIFLNQNAFYGIIKNIIAQNIVKKSWFGEKNLVV